MLRSVSASARLVVDAVGAEEGHVDVNLGQGLGSQVAQQGQLAAAHKSAEHEDLDGVGHGADGVGDGDGVGDHGDVRHRGKVGDHVSRGGAAGEQDRAATLDQFHGAGCDAVLGVGIVHGPFLDGLLVGFGNLQ
jgi:hypothetical protein